MATNGYQHLSNSMHGTTSGAIAVRFMSNPRTIESQPNSNSTPATYYSTEQPSLKSPRSSVGVELDLRILAAAKTEIITGNAPSKSSPSPAPFVIVRRSGTSASFGALIVVKDQHWIEARQNLTFEQDASGEYLIKGPHVLDRFSNDNNFDLDHQIR